MRELTKRTRKKAYIDIYVLIIKLKCMTTHSLLRRKFEIIEKLIHPPLGISPSSLNLTRSGRCIIKKLGDHIILKISC